MVECIFWVILSRLAYYCHGLPWEKWGHLKHRLQQPTKLVGGGREEVYEPMIWVSALS